MRAEGTDNVRSLVDELEKRPEVLGVALFGSTARGDNRPDSDVDLYVLVEEGLWRDVERRDGTDFEFVFSSEKESRSYWAAHPDDFVKMWSEAQILVDKEGTLGEFRKDAKRVQERGKTIPDERSIRHRRFDAEDQLRAIRALSSTDPSTASLALHRLVEALSAFFFDLRGEWTPAAKERLPAIRRSDPETGVAFDAFYSARTLDSQIDNAQSIVGRIFAQS